MRIVFLTSSMGAGGAERVATTLCNAWAERGDNVTLIATFSGGGKMFYRVSPEVEFIYLANIVGARKKTVFSYWLRIQTLRRLIAERRPDVIVSFLPNVNVAALISSAFLGVPVIICERSDPSIYPQPWLWEFFCKLSYRFADMLTVQTESVAAKVREIYPGLNSVRTIPNPLPAGISAISASQSGQRKTLLSLGRLSREKQIDKLLTAFAEVASVFPEWDLHIYGEGPLRSMLEGQIQSDGLEGRAILKGSTETPWRVMASADAFVMVSAYEGFPNSLLEAMGVGLPCITFDCPSGPREITGGGRDALLVPLNDHAGLVCALEKLMGDEALRKKLGNQAKDSVSRRFSLPGVINTWDGLFKEVGAIR
ncbi:MAG TPA: glycosyltransferase family 4 protein [Noviherbaspirillum sp.]|nr:glycosyltransferase family 4 protein [Noviherbaspirillum sp.]